MPIIRIITVLSGNCRTQRKPRSIAAGPPLLEVRDYATTERGT